MNKLLATSFAASLLLGATSAMAHPHPEDEAPPHEDSGHAGEHRVERNGEHSGVYDHGHDDGHHHHPHSHQPAQRRYNPSSPDPYGYRYRYPQARQPAAYNYNTKPRIIEGWEPGDPVPDGYRPDTRPHSGLVKGGAATLFSLWGISAIAGSFLVVAEDEDAEDGVDGNGIDAEDYYPLFIPVVGPFVTIGTAETSRAASVALVADGIGQTAGLAMFIAGLAARQDVLVRIPTYGKGSMEVRPVVGKGFQGVGVNGSF